MFWRKQRKQVEAMADDALRKGTDLAEKSLVIGPGGVAMLLAAAAIGAAATYYVAQKRKTSGRTGNKKA